MRHWDQGKEVEAEEGGVEEVMPQGTPQAEQLLAKGVAALGELVAFLKLKKGSPFFLVPTH